jgi:hypothetical protein
MAKRMKVKLKDVLLFEDAGYGCCSMDLWCDYARVLGFTLKLSAEPVDAEPECKSA